MQALRVSEKLRQVAAAVDLYPMVAQEHTEAEAGLTVAVAQEQHHLRFLHQPQHTEDTMEALALTHQAVAVAD